MADNLASIGRRTFLASSACAVGAAVAAAPAVAQEQASPIVVPPAGKRILLSCKLGMIAKKDDGKDLTLVER